jgi:general secretion pathway protein B
MSYILDALKKAESERKLGAIPNVHAQAMDYPALDEAAPPWRRPALLAGAAALLAMLGALAWYQPWRDAPAAPMSATPAVEAPAAALTATLPEPPPAANNSTVLAPSSPPPIASASAAPAHPARDDKAVKPKHRVVKESGESPIASTARPDDSGSGKSRSSDIRASHGTVREARAAKPAAPASPPQAEPAEAAVALRDLPEAIRREIPAMTINGYIYAGKPADRSVIINNKLLREGDQVAPGLTLERMLPKEAVMNYRGQRYRLAY